MPATPTNEMLIQVDADDREIGSLSKAECHAGEGVLHRAFSVFLSNSKGVLLQQRSAEKPLWPLYWSNACCSHPRVGEHLQAAAQRRLQEELGLAGIALEHRFQFTYHARFADVGSERELCHVFTGVLPEDAELRAAPAEIADWRFAARAQVDAELARCPDSYTPWFVLEWPRVQEFLA